MLAIKSACEQHPSGLLLSTIRLVRESGAFLEAHDKFSGNVRRPRPHKNRNFIILSLVVAVPWRAKESEEEGENPINFL
jgi:hypothetical protein